MFNKKQLNKVFIGVPTYDGRIEESVMNAMFGASQQGGHMMQVTAHSLLAHNFNRLWCMALNSRKDQGTTHFAMLHADVGPEGDWLKKMLMVMDQTESDIVGCVIPLKGPKGLTSIGIDRPTEKDPWLAQRLSLKEIFALEPTFTDERLLVNTGLLLIDITKPWVDEKDENGELKAKFEINDRIVFKDGKYQAQVEPEDWGFCRKARKLGAKITATRTVKIRHIGRAEYLNTLVWGTCESDPFWTDDDKKENENADSDGGSSKGSKG